jgi:hypothetical protein
MWGAFNNLRVWFNVCIQSQEGIFSTVAVTPTHPYIHDKTGSTNQTDIRVYRRQERVVTKLTTYKILF